MRRGVAPVDRGKMRIVKRVTNGIWECSASVLMLCVQDVDLHELTSNGVDTLDRLRLPHVFNTQCAVCKECVALGVVVGCGPHDAARSDRHCNMAVSECM